MADGIERKAARTRLKPRREPYWSRLRAGVYVGFRKLEDGAGTWIGRYRTEDGKQVYRALGEFEEYDPARQAAEDWAASLDKGVTHEGVTVRPRAKRMLRISPCGTLRRARTMRHTGLHVLSTINRLGEYYFPSFGLLT